MRSDVPQVVRSSFQQGYAQGKLECWEVKKVKLWELGRILRVTDRDLILALGGLHQGEIFVLPLGGLHVKHALRCRIGTNSEFTLRWKEITEILDSVWQHVSDKYRILAITKTSEYTDSISGFHPYCWFISKYRQSAPEGKVDILGGHNISHSK